MASASLLEKLEFDAMQDTGRLSALQRLNLDADEIYARLGADGLDEPYKGVCPGCGEAMVRTEEVKRTAWGFKARRYVCPDCETLENHDPYWVYQEGPLEGYFVPFSGDEIEYEGE